MAEADHGVIGRKVAAARAEKSEGGPGADRCWRLALAKAARDSLKISLDVASLVLARRSLAEFMEMPPARSLIAVLDGPAEALGVIVLDAQILTGFIEAQTTGRIKSGEPPARKPTRTDAAMAAGVIDAALIWLEQALLEEADLVWAGGFRYASFLEDVRPLGLLLDDAPLRVLTAEVALAGGLRSGQILLALPSEGRGIAPSAKTDDLAQVDHGHVFLQALGDRVQGASSRIEAVLDRLTLALGDVMNLAEGDILALPQASLDRISLEGLDGRRVADGRLGQNRGMRAVRLNDALSDAHQARSAEPLMPAMMAPIDFGNALSDPGMADLGDMMFQATGTD